MFRICALGGASTIVLCSASFVAGWPALAQTAGSALPPVTVDAPTQRQSARPAKKRIQRNASAARPRKPVVTAATNPPAPQGEGSGVTASLTTPPIKQRFSLPQESYSITAKQIDETINLKDPEDAVKYMPEPVRAQAQRW